MLDRSPRGRNLRYNPTNVDTAFPQLFSEVNWLPSVEAFSRLGLSSQLGRPLTLSVKQSSLPSSSYCCIARRAIWLQQATARMWIGESSITHNKVTCLQHINIQRRFRRFLASRCVY